ncbi:PREDICTED: putative defensin-like protein 9 [Camelina sativa]|uniref:Defensin-like protein 9 n=1 Tax=Camelina sativa TaxID=90675 RepID=A0ABM1RQT4_CAMSA|nr:PREDICTED: putative defensin-like protein 9 [Camelina sativa]XP_019101371.1 PREDICTED: putative defensin-like protein 9 [Camelina sativa]XP_019101372.1 PREDICTED: putative defensin-like protein 9 [Camelina sativa]XP_019101373.1 PREDICTED: putative defensin-like protein 9 [Camelina sativa]XP_019101374.1 PREDICTED: putative defensin-like protein 9 [Camelina sativa]XP_019101375.1 PREDICTED: putative defensin-like protein 9 [Camelina sativa]XP_019101376.1 PREDICTED: putative defensin-like prot
MKSSMQFISTLFFLILLVLGPGVIKMVEGQPQMCEAQSLNYRGFCVSWRICKRVCMSEGFPDGQCKGEDFFDNKKCMCMKPCAM